MVVGDDKPSGRFFARLQDGTEAGECLGGALRQWDGFDNGRRDIMRREAGGKQTCSCTRPTPWPSSVATPARHKPLSTASNSDGCVINLAPALRAISARPALTTITAEASEQAVSVN